MAAPLILALDTAGPVVGLALVQGGRLHGAWCARVVRGAEARLTPAISELLQGRRPDAIAIANGPGAFTGLRVGVATGLGLATAWGCPVVPVSSLQARAAMAGGHGRVLALLDARKGRFYGGLFDARPALPTVLVEERDLPIDQLLPVEPCLAVGEGASVARASLLAAGHLLASQPDANPAPALARLGAGLLELGHGLAAHQLGIRYLRPPDAVPPRDLARDQDETETGSSERVPFPA
jgi:tRNA threonylcarbamoyladenosine biosynthesis protein TsaB